MENRMTKKICLLIMLTTFCTQATAHNNAKSHKNLNFNLDIKNMSPYQITVSIKGSKTVINRNMLEVPVKIAVGDTVRITARVGNQDISDDFSRTTNAERVWYVHVYQEPHKATMSIKIEKANTYR
jgi:hypothetical protein